MERLPGNQLGDAISEMAQYCENEQDFLELANVIVNEIDEGAEDIGVVGSRATGNNHPRSDLDLIIQNPRATEDILVPDSISTTQCKGRFRRLNKGPLGIPLGRWIHITRFSFDEVDDLINRPILSDLIVNAKWLYHQNSDLFNSNEELLKSVVGPQAILNH